MKAIRIPMMAIMAAAILVIPVGISALQQQVFAPDVDASDYVAWYKATHDFEKTVIGIIDPNQDPIPHLRPLLAAYEQEVMRIFLGGPDTIPELLEQYQLDVLAVFQAPPEPDKQAQHDQIKDFRQLTRAFEKAVQTEVLTIPHVGFIFPERPI